MSKRTNLIIALDIGTGSVRAHLFDYNGNIENTVTRSIRVDLGPFGKAEMDPEEIWKSVCYCIRNLIEGVPSSRLVALGVASALGYLLIDGKDNLLTSAILWMDRRANEEVFQIRSLIDENRLYSITGRRLDPEIFLAKLIWIRKKNPEIFFRASCFLGIKDEVIRRLTGTRGTDLTHASYSMLYDVTRFKWSEEILKLTGIPEAILPELRRADQLAGYINKQGAAMTGLPEGLPVITGTSDGTAGCLAAGVSEKGMIVNVTGTSDVIMTSVPKPILDPKGRTFLNPHPVLDLWMVGGVLGTTGGTLQWFVEKFCPDLKTSGRFESILREASKAKIGANGLIFLTGLAGERAPHWNPLARGVLFGLNLTHGRGEVARSILEGVALNIKEILDILKEIGVSINSIQVVGGGAKSDFWNQIRADVTGYPISCPKFTEGTALGIVLLTGLAIGFYSDLAQAARQIAPIDKRFMPNQENMIIYNEIAKIRRRLIDAINDQFVFLDQFCHNLL